MSLKKLHELFQSNITGFIPQHLLIQTHSSNIRISKVASKYGYFPTYKPNSKKLQGYGDYRYADNWDSPKLNQSGA